MIKGITNVNLDLTTNCDQRCPNCCAGIGINRVLQHHPWEYFERAAKVLYGIERVCLSGGEPTFHPQFPEFVPKFKDLFGCKTLAMVTDGWGVNKHFDVIAATFDEIDFSYYHTNPGALAMIKHLMPHIRLNVYDAGQGASNFTPRDKIGPGGACQRAWWRSGTIAYADGRVHGCCVAPGIKPDGGLLTIAMESAMEIPDPPCASCWWSE